MGTGDEIFTSDVDRGEQVNGNIRNWSMDPKTANGTFLFHSVEPGRRSQGYVLHEHNRQEEVE